MNRRILYICNDGFYFGNHRGHLALRMLGEGWDVLVATGGDAKALPHPLKALPLDIERLGLSPLRDPVAMRRIMTAIDEFSPDVVHLITMKPIVLAVAAFLLAPRRVKGLLAIVATFPGLGRVFEGDAPAQRLRRAAVVSLLKRFFSSVPAVATFENAGDRDTLVELGVISPSQGRVMSGAGIDLSSFSPRPEPSADRPFRALWASRLVHGKGLVPFIDAARLARQNGVPIEFMVAGYADPGHPDSLSATELEALGNEPSIRFLGHVTGMAELLRSVDTVVLPSSYNEGLPRILIEAAACALPLVASDSPGCRVLVEDGKTGQLLSEIAPKPILETLEQLSVDRDRARLMGRAAHDRVWTQGFDNRSIQDAFIACYGRI